jgi:hypothetical protein
MKTLNRLGDALLARVVPGIDARAACTSCRRTHFRCQSCCKNGTLNTRWYFYDGCGNYCYHRCYTQGLECPPDRPISC